eukprot:TRINITY_DN998_c0_g2_i1.p1 TRINITY_DN998_c0_g2~~TRINITY_DN998_c0_g2_i1.p1  ORF type:complete len:158 (+),score=13.06 TRINITY_DN998_c0_g2_i1:3-476(+)
MLHHHVEYLSLSNLPVCVACRCCKMASTTLCITRVLTVGPRSFFRAARKGPPRDGFGGHTVCVRPIVPSNLPTIFCLCVYASTRTAFVRVLPSAELTDRRAVCVVFTADLVKLSRKTLHALFPCVRDELHLANVFLHCQVYSASLAFIEPVLVNFTK